MSEIRKVGFIGVGNMGNPMAGHLVKAGFDVTVFDSGPKRCRRSSRSMAARPRRRSPRSRAAPTR